jgi:WD40 repeat protein
MPARSVPFLAVCGLLLLVRPGAAEEPRPARVDPHGDPLPPGAVARLGTLRFRDHGWVHALAYAPDGKTLASAGWRNIHLWDPSTGKLRRQFPGDGKFVRCLAFSPDGKWLASGGDENIIRLWDAATGKEVRQLRGHQIDPETKVSGVNDLAFASDGKTLVSAGRDKTVRLWEVATGKEVRQYKGHATEVCSLALSPDGKLLAAHYGGPLNVGFVKLWEVRTAKELSQFDHIRWVRSLVFSPDSKTLATAGGVEAKDTPVVLWDVVTGKQVRSFGEKQGPQCVAFSADGKTLAAGGWDQTVRLWDVATGKETRRLRNFVYPVTKVALAPGGKHIAVACNTDQTVHVREIAAEGPAPTGHVNGIQLAAFSPDCRLLVTSAFGDIRVWNVATRKELRRFEANSVTCTALSFLPDGKVLVAAGLDGGMGLWDVATGREVRRLHDRKPPGTSIYRAALSADGKLLVADVEQHMGFGPSERGLVVWDVATGKEVRRLDSPLRWISGMAFSPDCRTLAAAGGDPDSRLRTWDVTTGRAHLRLGKRPVAIDCATFSPDGKLLAGSCMDGHVHLWEAASGLERLTLKSKYPVTAVAFSPDGRVLATINNGGWRGVPPVREEDVTTIRFWDVATGKALREFTGHLGPIATLAFSPDGKHLVTGSHDTTALLWDVSGIRRQRHGPAELGREELQALWSDLAGNDWAKVHRAVWALADDPARSVPLLGERVRPVVAADAKVTNRLIADLGSSRFAVREKAARELESLGEAAHPALRAVLAGSPALEVRRRVERLLERPPAAPPAASRTVEVLEHAGTPEARELLRRLARGLPDAGLTKEARASLARLTKRSPR